MCVPGLTNFSMDGRRRMVLEGAWLGLGLGLGLG